MEHKQLLEEILNVCTHKDIDAFAKEMHEKLANKEWEEKQLKIVDERLAYTKELISKPSTRVVDPILVDKIFGFEWLNCLSVPKENKDCKFTFTISGDDLVGVINIEKTYTFKTTKDN